MTDRTNEGERLLAVWRGGLGAKDICANVSEWAERFRFLTRGESARPGRWDPGFAPYLNAIMDAAAVDHPARRVVVKGSNQIGKSASLANMIGYRIHQWPVPIMVVCPRGEDVADYTNTRIGPMIESTPVLRSLIGTTENDGAGENTAALKRFPGGKLVIAGSSSKSTYTADPYGMVILDDLDAFRPHPDGDHSELAEARTRTFSDHARKLIEVSTPTSEGSRIDCAYQASSQNLYWVPCMGCGAEQVLWRKYMRWPGGPSTAHFVCQHCGRTIEESERAAMVAAGQWRPERPELAGVVEGFWIWAAYAPFERWADLARKWVAATRHLEQRHDDEKIRTCRNLDWAESFVPQSEIQLAEQERRVYKRREPVFVKAQLPLICTTAGVDVQANRVEASVYGWGAREEAWLLEHRVVKGGYEHDATWDELFEWLLAMEVNAACTDAAVWPDHVHGQLTRLGPKVMRAGCLLYGIHGKHGPGPLWPHLVQPGNVKDGRTQTVTIRSDAGKDWLLGSLQRIEEPGPGYVHIDLNIGKALIKQLLSERERSSKDPRSTAKYIKRHGRERNEALDCGVYARAALLALATWDPAIRAGVFGLAEEQDGRARTPGPKDAVRRARRRRRRGIRRGVL